MRNIRKSQDHNEDILGVTTHARELNKGLHFLHHLERGPHSRAHAHGSRHLRQRGAVDEPWTVRHVGGRDD